MAACTGAPAVDALHHTADSLIAAGRPDSALLLLQTLDSAGAGVGGDLKSPVPARVGAGPVPARERPASLSRRQRMRHELLRARAMNKAYVDFSTDSVMKVVAGYYDRHGTPNERMEAHYLLGCTYRDMGEAPRAVDCYLDAAACADTTATDCDFYTLASIYGQMAKLYHQQLLLSYETEAHRKASSYHFLAKDTLHAIFEIKIAAGAYILQNKKDSAEAVILKAMNLYNENGFIQEALLTSTLLMHLYSEQPNRITELKRLIDTFDNKSAMFDENHELPPTQRLFFCYRARYYEATNQLDSAEFYYRKMHCRNMLLTSRNSMYKGLLGVFSKRSQGDSIAKYAQLYCAVNDSSITIKDQEVTAQLSASYQYNCIQKESNRNAEEARRAKFRLFLAFSLLFLFAAFTIFLIYHYKRQRRKQLTKYFNIVAERTKLQEELDSLKARDYDAVISRKEEEIANLNKSIAEHYAIYREVMLNDKLAVFQKSNIVKTFSEKSNFRKSCPGITNDEWDELVGEFRRDMPSACSMMKSLSPLQLHVCILLLLEYDESVIAALKNSMPQTINKAKVRANEKLFKTGDAASLSSNLKKIIIT